MFPAEQRRSAAGLRGTSCWLSIRTSPQNCVATVVNGRDSDLYGLILEVFGVSGWRVKQQFPLVRHRHAVSGSVLTRRCGAASPIGPAVELRNGTRQRGLGVHFDALPVQFDLPPLLQDGRTRLVAGDLLQSAGQVPWSGLYNGGLHETTVRQAFGRRAWRADDGLEVVELL